LAVVGAAVGASVGLAVVGAAVGASVGLAVVGAVGSSPCSRRARLPGCSTSRPTEAPQFAATTSSSTKSEPFMLKDRKGTGSTP
jgi:hypothetical protein